MLSLDSVSPVEPGELQTITLFRNVEENVLNYIAGRARRQTWEPTDTLVKQQSVEKYIYLVKRGVCHMMHKDVTDVLRHQGYRYTGNQIGLAGTLAQREHYGTTVALTRCETLRIVRSDLLAAMPFSRTLIENSYVEIADRFHALMELQQWGIPVKNLKLQQLEPNDRLPSKEIIQKVAAFLVEWERVRLANDNRTGKGPEHMEFRLTEGLLMPEEILAKRLGVESTGLSRAISYLLKQGYIQREAGKVKAIHDIKADKLQSEFCQGFTFPGSEPAAI